MLIDCDKQGSDMKQYDVAYDCGPLVKCWKKRLGFLKLNAQYVN